MGTGKIEFEESVSTDQLLEVIDDLNKDEQIFGILLQHPVPKHIDERACFNRIVLQKDVDGVTALGFGKMALGEDAFQSATPGGIIRLLKHYDVQIEGKKPL